MAGYSADHRVPSRAINCRRFPIQIFLGQACRSPEPRRPAHPLLSEHSRHRNDQRPGAYPIGQVPDLDNPIADLDPVPRSPTAATFAGAIAQRHDTGLCRAAATAFEHHQIAVIERTCPHPHQDLSRSWPRILAHAQHDPVDAAEAVDVVRFILSSSATAGQPRRADARMSPLPTVGPTRSIHRCRAGSR
jgi:hypothetical protein